MWAYLSTHIASIKSKHMIEHDYSASTKVHVIGHDNNLSLNIIKSKTPISQNQIKIYNLQHDLP